MKKILSIIVPTYNMEKYLSNCLDSLVLSDPITLRKIDVIVVNDGSKDSSLIIAKKYEQLYPDAINVIDKSNGNYGSCINKGLAEAKGKYVKILDADDSYNVDVLKSYLEKIENLDVDLILNDYSVVDSDGKTKYVVEYSKIPAGEVIETDWSCMPGTATEIAMHGVAYRTDMLRGILYTQTEGISYTDEEWIFRPMLYVNTIYNTRCNLYQYLIGRDGQTVSIDVMARKLDQLAIVALGMFKTPELSTLNTSNSIYAKERLLRICRTISQIYILNGYKYLTFSLEQFDRDCQLYVPDIYKEMNSETLLIGRLLPIHHIRAFRKHGINTPVLKLLRNYWLIKNQIKKIIR